MPAEWEPQSAIQLTWPHKGTDWAPYLQEITDTYVEMAREIAKREHLLIVVPSRDDLPKEVLEMGSTTIFECPTNDTWARDHGFITLIPTPNPSRTGGECDYSQEKVCCSHEGDTTDSPSANRTIAAPSGAEREASGERLLLLDFQFNGWGKKFPAEKDNAINRRLWESLFSTPPVREGLGVGSYEDHNDFVLEGGSIESDGRGTIYTTRCCLMAPNRNQPMTEQEIEAELKRRLHADRIVWLDDEPLPGDDTDGHIDTLARITPDGTLLRLPLPNPIYDEDGNPLPATYANYLIINGAVLVPTYNQPENDQRAISRIQAVFPDREMVPIDSRSIIKQHGSIHCCTMQYY